jgi:predicted dehydrogenase
LEPHARNGTTKTRTHLKELLTVTYRMIQVGTGGMGAAWCRAILPPFVASGAIEVVAAVDINPDVFVHAQEGLGLPAERCYTDLNLALDDNPADFLTIVVPPAAHEAVVDVALAHDMDILSEKPIADTMEASVRIAQKVRTAGKKMGVTMSHRFDQDKSTLRDELRSGRYGQLDYLVCRFSCDARRFGSWGKFRHEIPDALMVEGAVHHLDILADLAGAHCTEIYAQTWNPSWGEFAGDSQGLVTMRFENGARAIYEGAKTNATGLNCWGQEYIRAEAEGATLVLDHRQIERFVYDPAVRNGIKEPVPLSERPHWSHGWLMEQFLDWLDGGEPMPTNVEDNLQSVALIFAAIESSQTGRPVAVQEFLATAMEGTPVISSF